MPDVELFNPHAHSDGWHDVRSPGGYEWWYFDAEDAATDTQLVAIFMQGFIFHPGYLRKYEKFRKHPTLTLPSVAADFPCTYLCVYRGGKVWKQFFTQYPRSTFRADADCCEVAIGLNTLRLTRDKGYSIALNGTPWDLTTRGPQTRRAFSMEASFYFKPQPTPLVEERPFLSKAMTKAMHRWTVVAPRCAVKGSIIIRAEGTEIDEIAFKGHGYHDHNYGTAPIGEGLARWTWGRAFFGDDRVVTFHHAEPKDRSLPVETHLIEASAASTREIGVDRVVADWSLVSNPAMRLRYPRTLDFGPALKLSEPRVIDPSPFYLRLQFKAESFGETSTAFCEIAYPHRLRWPLLGRMIEMSFDKR